MEDYDEKGTAPAAEKKELERIFREGHTAGLSVGAVNVYLMNPDGRLVDSIHVAEAAKPGVIQDRLDKLVNSLGVSSGQPVIPPANVADRHRPADAALVLHVVARREDRGSWGEFPSENWIAWSADEVSRMVPPAGSPPGTSIEIPPELARRIVRHLHPQTEDCSDADRNKIERASLHATVMRQQEGEVHVKLAGALRMKRAFYPNGKDERVVDATVTGYARVRDGNVTAFNLVTERATYGKEKFSAVVSVAGR